MSRKRLGIALVFLMVGLAAGCIETKPPVIDARSSVAPEELVGAWLADGSDDVVLVEALDERRLRVSLFDDDLEHRGEASDEGEYGWLQRSR